MARFSTIFAPELHGRLLWFGRLRWLAVSGLAVASVLGPPLGFHAVWPSLFVVASVVALYNIVFQRLLLRGERSRSFANMRVIAIGLMVMDLAALMVPIHFTGGLQSPLLPFFAFHMAIGAVMMSSRTVYMLAGGVALGALGLLVLESRGILQFHPLTTAELDLTTASLNLLTLVAALFGIVYLTDSVAGRLKGRSIELYETTRILSERSDELQSVIRKMEQVEHRKSHYMRISAHQLRSPLGTIKTVLGVLTRRYVDPSSDEGRKLLDGAVEVADGLLEVVNDLLDLARVREGRDQAPWKHDVNINQLLADLVDSLSSDAEQRQVEMVPDFEGVAVLDRGVPPALVQTFENLLYNAIKYSRPGGRVTVRLRILDGVAVIDVIDRGIGIPEGYLDQVFLEFVRAPNAKRHTTEGTGLGLAIAKEVVEFHGGEIAAESVDGRGTTFTVRLPLHPRTLPAGNDSGYPADTGEKSPAPK